MRVETNAGRSGSNQNENGASVQAGAEGSLADQASADQARAGWLAGQAARTLPEIRSERIAAVQSAIANGTYHVSPEQTAEAILSEQQVRDEAAA
jgi:flagellar biosynthesis anti-sigma factor FlgM